MSDTKNRMKREAAEAALGYLEPGTVVGVGTGSTADFFIDALALVKEQFVGAVASSERSEKRLLRGGVKLLDLEDVSEIPVYVDGADESDRKRRLIKGGGGALTREKIVAQASMKFICIVDDSKLVEQLGAFPLPVEVIPMATNQVCRALRAMGGIPQVREGFVTDNRNRIVDVSGLDLSDPESVETALNQIPGTVTNGLFTLRPADLIILGTEKGIEII